MITQEDLVFRDYVTPYDRGIVRDLTTATNMFSTSEIEVAVELVEERLQRGNSSGYQFIFAEIESRPIGYSCFGAIPCTTHSFDLYWIVVDPSYQRMGIGVSMLQTIEFMVSKQGGRRLYAETSSRALYTPTRNFYLSKGFSEAAQLPEFYAPGDAKIIYVKILP